MFSHDLRDPLLHITFRKTIESSSSLELINLAKLAVAGDEVALDQLTNWRPKTAARNLSHTVVKDNHCFYVGSQSGILFYINQSGTCTEVFKNDSPIIQILFHPKREAIVTLMEDMTVGHFLVESSGNLTELDRVKLSSRMSGYDGAISWAGNSLAIITGDLTVRIWDIDTSDNFLLPTDHASVKNIQTKNFNKTSSSETFSSICYCSQNQTLTAGTNQGSIYVWRRSNYSAEAENGWQLTDIASVRGAIKQCIWGIVQETLNPCIVVNCISNVYILKEQPLMSHHTRTIWATQRSANQILIESINGHTSLVTSDIVITNLSVNDFNLALTNGKQVSVYKIQRSSQESMVGVDQSTEFHLNDTLSARFSTNFNCDNINMFMYEQNIICVTNENRIVVNSLNGVKLQELIFTDHEGKPIGSDLSGKYLTIFTLNGYIKVFDVSRHELKLVVPTKNAYDLFENFGEVIMAKANKEGTFVAMTIATESLVPDGKLYIWKLESDQVVLHDFIQKENSENVPRLPISFHWDTDDPRLLACEAKLIQSKSTLEGSIIETQIYLMFPSTSKVLELEVINLTSNENLINLCTPNIITLKVGVIGQKIMRDFIGLQNTDEDTRKMVLNFSINVAQGNLDQAFICIRSLQSEAVWSNLAKMCVQTGRLDVAKICLGHLKNGRSVRAVRKALDDYRLEPEAKTAVLAIELGMIEEAEKLYKKCGRFDLLNKLLQNCGRFEEALKIAENFDRVNLKNTKMRYGQWLSENGDTAEAIKMFQQTSDPVYNITQMLLEDPPALRKFMQSTSDPAMLKWYAQYIESTGDMENAFKIYQKADDHFSQVRILCFLGQLTRADSIARNSGDKSACYHLARHYENIGKFQDAIQFYSRAQTYSNAVRICRDNDLQEELWNVASAAKTKEDKVNAAAYFEECGDFKRAVELYHRAGYIHKAVEMAFTSQQPEILQVIASELNESSDPELIERCAEFFQSINLNQKAVLLLANSKQYDKALDVCSKNSVPITDTIAGLLTPEKSEEMSDEKRNSILIHLGELLQEQGDYHTATKKFTQAGDKIRAMKSLLKSGDTEKVVFFAGMSRQKEIYIMAANYLQSLDWQNDQKILKNIITFYTKGQAHELLANFYTVCAQSEIDEYRDYDKALKALQEAAKIIMKISQTHNALEKLQQSVVAVKRFIELQDLAERREFNSVLVGCKNLAVKEQPPLRLGDVLGLLIEAQIATKQYSEAMQSLRELSLKQPDWASREIIDKSLVEKLANETGVDFTQLWNSGRNPLLKQDEIDHSDDEIDEEEDEEEIEENLVG